MPTIRTIRSRFLSGAALLVAVGGFCGANYASFRFGGVWDHATNPQYVFPPDSTPYSEAELQRNVEREVVSRCGNTVDPGNVRILAMTIWGEARGEGSKGMRAVAHVIDNRVKSLNDKQYGKTLREVVTRDFQFSAWNTGDPNLTKMTVVDALDPNSEDWAQWIVAQRIAEDVLTGRSTDPIEGRRFYHSVSVQPSWAAYGTGPKRVGQHIFYYDASLPG